MIYILCPASYATGGPELLHQLGYKLNLLGFEANMVYFNIREGENPTCPQYEKYRVPVSTQLQTSLDHVVVVPEMSIPFIQRLFPNSAARIAIWWLSVDNAVFDESDIAYIKAHTEIVHLAQSMYALNYVKDHLGIRPQSVFYLSDYINTDFLVTSNSGETLERCDTVLFNPQKGIKETLALIAFSDARVKWQALRGLSPAEMVRVMRQAKVYIDFGFHPGKDRIPREAALCGCCIITNRKGSANNPYDVAIPDRCKFDHNAEPVEILDRIYELVEHYEERKADYLPYIENIRREYWRFETDVFSIFQAMQPNHIPFFHTPQEYIDCILEKIDAGNYQAAYQSLIKYKTEGYEETIDTIIFETAIRMGIQEYREAELCALRGLSIDPQNYELYLYMAELNAILGPNNQVKQYSKMALEYSKGTLDEGIIRARCAALVPDIDAI